MPLSIVISDRLYICIFPDCFQCNRLCLRRLRAPCHCLVLGLNDQQAWGGCWLVSQVLHVPCVLNHESYNQMYDGIINMYFPKSWRMFSISVSERKRRRYLTAPSLSAIFHPVFSQWADDTFLTEKLDDEESVQRKRITIRTRGGKIFLDQPQAVLFTVLMLCLGTDLVTPVSHQLGWDQRAVEKIRRGGEDQGRDQLYAASLLFFLSQQRPPLMSDAVRKTEQFWWQLCHNLWWGALLRPWNGALVLKLGLQEASESVKQQLFLSTLCACSHFVGWVFSGDVSRDICCNAKIILELEKED